MATSRTVSTLVCAVALGVCAGCRTSGRSDFRTADIAERPAIENSTTISEDASQESLQLASLEEEPAQIESESDVVIPDEPLPPGETLLQLESLAISNNPTLRRLQHEACAAWDKARYVDQLPDPSVGSTFYLPPMNFEPDRQVAEVRLMQMIPWLARLEAEAQKACMNALAAQNMYQAERLRVIGDLRANWFKLYVLSKQIETTEADKDQLESLINTASGRVATGDAQPGDVLMATLELTSLEEQLISYRQQVVATTAELNRLVGRYAAFPIAGPASIENEFPNWSHELLRKVAFDSQPELNAARLRSAATRWGVEVARLERRPDLTFGIGWVVMDAPGATMSGAGRDSVMLEVSTTLPIRHQKYDAMLSEATREHYAAYASEDEVRTRLDAMLADLWEQAEANHRTVELYKNSILPQARQTFEADQKSLINNTVTFDRVIRDYRSLLNLELGYQRALGQQATTLARIRQTIGVDLVIPRESQGQE